MRREISSISPSEAKDVKDSAAQVLRENYGNNVYAAICDWAQADIVETHRNLEIGTDTQSIFRAQGRLQAMRDLLHSLTPRHGGQ